MKDDTSQSDIYSSHKSQTKPTRDFIKSEMEKAKKEIQKIEQYIDVTKKLLSQRV